MLENSNNLSLHSKVAYDPTEEALSFFVVVKAGKTSENTFKA